MYDRLHYCSPLFAGHSSPEYALDTGSPVSVQLQPVWKECPFDGIILCQQFGEGGGALQDITARAVAATSRGCVWNQDLTKLAAAAGLRLVTTEPALGGLVTAAEASPES